MAEPTILTITDLTNYEQSPIPPNMKLLIEVNADMIPVEFGGGRIIGISNVTNVHLPPTSHIVVILDRRAMRI
jgi:hypothetical protein